MKFFQTFFLASLSRTVLLLGCTLGSLTIVEAQIPAFSITSDMPEFGAVQDGRRNIILRERRFSLMRYDTLPQRGRIVIRRTPGPTNATITLRMGVSYQSGTRLLPESTTATVLLPSVYTDASGRTQRFSNVERPEAIPINSLFGDLNPIFVVNGVAAGRVGTTYTQVYQVSFPPSVTEASIVCTARWSDQSFPANPGAQNPRTIFVALLRGEGYTIPPAVNAQGEPTFEDFARITLEDPVNIPPVMLPLGNSFCQMLSVNTAQTALPLESTLLDADGLPRSFFYDDNYDPITYTLSNSNSSALRAEILPSDTRFNGLPSLILSANPAVRSTTASLVITARDSRSAGSASTICPPISVITNVRTTDTPLHTAFLPNPADNLVTLRVHLPTASSIRVQVYSMLGAMQADYNFGVRPAGEQQFSLDIQGLSEGIYPVRIISDNEIYSAFLRVAR